jgi:hypothetical protein
MDDREAVQDANDGADDDEDGEDLFGENVEE